MGESETEIIPVAKNQSIVPTQKKMALDLMTVGEKEKRIAENKNRLEENYRKQELIDNEFVYFEKCPVRYVITKDDNGNELKGYKDKNRSTPEEHFNTLNKLTATQDILLSENIVSSAVSAQSRSQKNDCSVNIVNQVLADYEPKDSIEAKLCLQAHTLYTQGMQYLSRAENSNMLSQSDFYMKNAIKLLRLHNETVEALNRHRRGCTQKILIQHVQVNDGGKAIVGGILEGGGVNKK